MAHRMGRRGKSAIREWRVKLGNKTVFTADKKVECEEFIRTNKVMGKLKLVPPNW
jgi:hypothetical protein